MARTTQQIRDAWAPACKPRRVSLLSAYTALDRCFRAWVYGPRKGQTWGFNCRHITGGSGWSLHSYDPDLRFVFWTGVAVTMAVAVDINSLANPYGPRLITDMPRKMIDAILAIRTVDGVQVWKWGGYYSKNKDAMHFELNCTPAELERGIDWKTVPGTMGGGILGDLTREEQLEILQKVRELHVAQFEEDPVEVGRLTPRGTIMSQTDFNMETARRLGFDHKSGDDLPPKP